MGGVLAIFLLFAHLLLLPDTSSSSPLCTDSRAPVTLKTPLAFCPYNGSVCCNSTKDLQLQKQFEAMNVSDPACASLLKSILCATCDQFSAELFRIESEPRSVPVLCKSTISANASQSSSAVNDFCGKVWDTCQNISVLNSPFTTSLESRDGVPGNSTFSKLSNLWKSKSDFCDAFGGASADGSVCFDGQPVSLNNTDTLSPPNGVCLEKIGNGSYLNMVAHPDGSNRIFLADQKGKIWLATVPEEETGGILGIDELNPFLDLTDEVHFDIEFGLMGLAFHPDFTKNGRFFVSFNCDKVKTPGCSGRCSCNSDANCDPSKLSPDNGASPCQYHSVISEYTANGTASEVSLATRANPIEVRRIFTMGLPFTSHHAGQILFGPADGYLYFMMGDGGNSGDPYNFSQNKKSLLGKIMRLDINNIPSAKEIDALGLWGNYSIPKDNPFSEDKELQPEIWALGFRNPWRCSFDSERPSYFLCADVGQDRYEEVDIITKGGNYGWRVYEGPYLYNPPKSPGGNTSVNSITPIFPVMGYDHSAIDKNVGSASITGGYFYRAMTDPCIYGSYLYADLYAGNMWAGSETPENSGNFTTHLISFNCARDSPIQCTAGSGSALPALGYIFSFGEDNKKDVYILASSGVYRVVRPSRCGYTCSEENSTAPGTSPTPSSGSWLVVPFNNLVQFCCSLLVVLGLVL
ncbi:PREDICTED: HIPL1 protein [Nelumbo nucifera]|uniref:HIPL1 protein n=1 Tax=Nelumbo nucifera TaxID=4432 RepID=A0A1U8AW11_NELNU|nr:PREDICTED: HIPL1 protein [Nelumbo nucifera]